MNSYIFITTEGYTFQPKSEAIEPDIENCHVIGFTQGIDEKDAFQNLVKEKTYLFDTTFDELISLELKHTDYNKYVQRFYLASYGHKEPTKERGDNYKLIISDIDAGGAATIDLYYDKQTGNVKEEKILADTTVLSVELTVDEFDPENYGDEGVEFLKKINIV